MGGELCKISYGSQKPSAILMALSVKQKGDEFSPRVIYDEPLTRARFGKAFLRLTMAWLRDSKDPQGRKCKRLY